MFYHISKSLIAGLPILLSTLLLTSSRAFAQTSPDLESSPLVSGTYSRLIQQIQIVRSDNNICIHGFLDSERQAQELAAVEQIRQATSEAEAQLQVRLREDAAKRTEELQLLLQDESRLNAALESGQITSEQAQQIRAFQNDPQALYAFVEEQFNEAEQRARLMIEQQRIDAEAKLREAAGRLFIQGVASLSLEFPEINAYRISGTSLIIIPQAGQRLALGEPNKLHDFVLSEDTPLPENESLQQCLDSQQPYSQLVDAQLTEP